MDIYRYIDIKGSGREWNMAPDSWIFSKNVVNVWANTEFSLGGCTGAEYHPDSGAWPLASHWLELPIAS